MYESGELINERYQLERELGKGGFSVVWLAKDKFTETRVAIKIFAPDKGLDQTGLQQFQKEYVRTRGIKHPHLLVPEHFDIIRSANSPFLVIPYCPRGSIHDQLHNQGVFSEANIALLLQQIAGGLKHLHKQGVIHQDIKPDNILIDDRDQYQLTDFGISRKMRSTLNKATANQSYMTLSYSPPERYSANPIDTPSSDIFSLGVMIYELCTGSIPWDGAGGMVLNSGAAVPNLPDIFSNRFREWVRACMDKNHELRPTADDLLNAAQAYLNDNSWPKWESKKEPQPAQREAVSSRKTQKVNPVLQELKAAGLGASVDAGAKQTIADGLSKAPARPAGSIPAPRRKLTMAVTGTFALLVILNILAYTGLLSSSTYEQGVDLYLKGDYANAFDKFDEAMFIESDYRAALYLGRMYREGEAVPKDLDEASYYYQEAISGGDLRGYYGLARVEDERSGFTVGMDEELEEQIQGYYEQAFASVELAALEGDPLSLSMLQYYYFEGIMVDQDLVESTQLVQRAADAGYAEMIRVLATRYQDGEGVEKDEARAIELLNQVINRYDLARAYNSLGFTYGQGLGVEQSQEEAFKLFQQASDRGHAVGTSNVGLYYHFGRGVDVDKLKARDFYEESIRLDRYRGQPLHQLGNLYKEGEGGVEQDYGLAVDYYEQAIDLGYKFAMVDLAEMYENGNGVIRSIDKAIELYEMAIATGDYEYAEYRLAVLYYDQGNYTKAMEWYKQSSETYTRVNNGGYRVNTYIRLGYMYYNGLGTSTNTSEAVRYWKKAAEDGDSVAQYNMGVVYENGRYGGRDLDEARRWYKLSADQGYDNAIDAYRRLS